MAVLTEKLDDPSGYGRIVRNDSGQVQRIVEHKDATPDELLLNEVNTGILVAPTGRLKDWLSRIDNNNAQGEYYLTDVVGLRSEEHTSELQSLMRISYAVFCLKKKHTPKN